MVARYLSNYVNRAVILMCGAAFVCAMFSPVAKAQSWNKKTTVTFSQPVEIPGAGAQVLPAGTYVFKLLDSLANRNIVQIFNKDETHLFATILAIPNYRLQATDKTVMTFDERTAGSPQAIRAWFYPGDNSGQEFVYPKTRAVELAKITNEPVLFMPDEAAPFIAAAAPTPAAAPVVALRETPLMAVQPTGNEVQIAEVIMPPPPTANALPKTAGSLPLIALAGLLSLTAAYSLRALWPR